MRIIYKNKQKLITTIIIIFCILLTIPIKSIAVDDKKEIKFNDINLYNSVIEQLDNSLEIEKDDSNYSITMNQSELEKVTSLKLNNNNISDISGLENFAELTELDISNNNIADISSLSSLTNLRELKAYGNKIADLTSIGSLTNLEYLNIAKNKLTDLELDSENTVTSVISGLINLTELDMSHNYLRYTNGLSTLKKLIKLNLYDNAIHDLTGLLTLTNLNELKLGENNENGSSTISGLEALSNLVKLTYLDFSENKTSTILNYINQLSNLETLNLESNMIEDVSSISSLSKLKNLNLYDNSVSSIEPLLTLANLEELIIQKNNITDLTGIINNHELVWTNLKKLDIANNNIDTAINNDLIQILCERSNDETIELNYENITDTSKLPHYDEDGVAYVTYDDFGARCNGIYDDFIAIKNAHIYANKYGYEVRATAGKTYHIYKYYEDEVMIKTNTNWSNANFIIHDEKIEDVSGRYKSLFEVSNISDTVTIKSPTWTIGTETTKITQLEGKLTTLNAKGYTQYLCATINSNKKQHMRYGSNANSGDSQQDYFLIDSEGNVLNDIQWDFDEITEFRIYPIPNSKMKIENGNFISNALTSQSEATYTRSGSEKSVYFSRNIYVKAANIKLSNINHRLSYEEGKDELSGSYKGFIYSIFCANMEITDCSLFTRKYGTTGRSTYDLNIYASVNVNCKNITSNNIEDVDRWGIVATYFAKDVLFENCTLNRIDAHQGIYNLAVKDCTIGSKGLTMTGQGTLNVINTEIESSSFITLRQDYGSTWNGDVNIIDCTYKPKDSLYPKLLFANLSYDDYDLHDFGYECKMPNINVYNLTIDMQNIKDYKYFSVMHIGNIKTDINYKENTKAYLQTYLPNSMMINGYNFTNDTNNSKIQISNRNLKSYLNDYNYVITNTKIKLNNADKEDITNETNLSDNFITNESVYLEVNSNDSAQNSVSIYKDDEAITENLTIDDIYTKTFTDNGTYQIILSSVDNIYQLTGEQIYKFTIDNQDKLNITIKEYETVQENETKYIENIKPGTTIEEVIENIETNGTVKVYQGNTQITDSSTKTATGMTIKISLGTQEETYTLVVTGDLNGDGQMGNIDLLKLVRYSAGLDTSLSGAYLKAADIYKDGTCADNKDLLKIARVLVGLEGL